MKYKKEISSGTSYLNPSRFISGRIVEYDIRSANISALLDAGVIDIDQYNKLNIHLLHQPFPMLFLLYHLQ